jgi:hypothetical protein
MTAAEARLEGPERRIPEQAIRYWQRLQAELGDAAGVAALGLDALGSEPWSHRFLLAIGSEVADTTLLLHGADFGRLLEMMPGKTPPLALKRKLPPRYSEIFLAACRDAVTHNRPVRVEGEVDRDDGKRELYRAAVIPLPAEDGAPVRFAFGAFSNRIAVPAPAPAADKTDIPAADLSRV